MKFDQVIVSKRPEQLYSGAVTFDDLKKRFRELVKVVHPDVTKDPRAGDAMILVQRLYDEAERAIAAGTWSGEDRTVRVRLGGGKAIKFSYVTKRQSEHSGLLDYTTHERAAFFLPENFSDDVKRASKLVPALVAELEKKPDMAKVLRQYFPTNTVVSVYERDDRAIMATVYRDKESVCLADVLAVEGTLTPKTAAWVISSLLDCCCTLSYLRTVHSAITARNVFIRPTKHSVQLVGGWWYASEVGKKIKRVPGEVYAASAKHLVDKRSKCVIDLESVKELGRTMLKGRTDVPKAMSTWLMLPSKKSAPEEYSSWEKARDLSFERKFHSAEFTTDGIHGKLNEKE